MSHGSRSAVALSLFALLSLPSLVATPASAQTLVVLPYVQDVTSTSAWILWETSDGDESTVAFGPTLAVEQSATGTVQPSVGTARLHEVQLEGLLPGARYYYRATTGTAVSEVLHFTTPPLRSAGLPFRFVAFSDTQTDSANPDIYRQIIHDGVIGLATATLTPELDDAFAFALVPGDLVEDGNVYAQWAGAFFASGADLMASVPFYPVLGNHEGNSPNYFRYFHLPANGSATHPEAWWTMDHGDVRVIGLDGNQFLLIGEQAAFFENAVSEACTDDTIDFVFVAVHQAHQSELWRTGEAPFTSNVVERMNRFSAECGKPSAHFHGHTHGYARGESRDASHLWINVATGGGNPDYWGEYPTQRDVSEVSVTQDEWGFVVVDVTPGAAPSFRLRRYSRGNELLARDNELRDEVTIRRFNEAPAAPAPLRPRGLVRSECNTLAAGAFSDPDGDLHGAAHWQVSERCDDFTTLAAESYRVYENWYGGLDTQAGDDLTDEPIAGLVAGRFYCWRVRYRDRALAWSAWSAPVAFELDAAGAGVAQGCDDPTVLVPPPPDAGPAPPPPAPVPVSYGCGCRVGGDPRGPGAGPAFLGFAALFVARSWRRRKARHARARLV
jgi:MYXO-CTERM domain-containing protein